MDESDPAAALAARLPQEIQTALKRKSSRDPNSRFPRKLHLLLSYLATDPALEEEIGLSWITDTEFKMKKKNVAAVMGIKLNTMNVNLRDLGFEQLQHDKNGWTEWKRDGFTRNTSFTEAQEPQAQDLAAMPLGQPSISALQLQPFPNDKPRRAIQKTKIYDNQYTPGLTIGQVSPSEVESFKQTVDSIWSQLVGQAKVVDCNTFIDKAAEFFKQPEQPIDNAKEVIKAIVAPTPKNIYKDDLYKFLAMFGPAKTAMLKIASLLLCSNSGGNWLYFDQQQQPPNPQSPMSGCFDRTMPNCLVLTYTNNGMQNVRRVWNLPMIDAYGTYLVDQNNTRYSQWDKIFESSPIQTTYEMPVFGYP